MSEGPSLVVGLNAVIIALTEDQPRVLTVTLSGVARRTAPGGAGASAAEASEHIEALPSGPLDPRGDRTLELALRRWVGVATGLALGYVEQLYTFGDRYRDPRERAGGPRVVSAAYLALVRESKPAQGLAAQWRSVYHFLPWEDFRRGRPAVFEKRVVPALRDWIRQSRARSERDLRRERAAIAFGVEGGVWDGERVLERYELLYQLGLVSEALVGEGTRKGHGPGVDEVLGEGMAHDHRRILAAALGRIRAKIKYRPVVFELMPESFSLLELQRAVEALAGVELHKQNFRRLVEGGGLVEPSGQVKSKTGGRPAALFRFRREVLLERPAPGVGLPRIDPRNRQC